ncbi:TRAP transporter large permease [Clostridium vitabionis]|jgi:tripartite ATP-independent transporter DctM subunit|uniref:TRAP transporter large permease n=1 Tax=Clostridium vitabionis TaxID=2784388 RepID=UPI00188D3D02|nr:TRAP transporter large permease [Clostridium vitabionis]
MLNAIGFFLVLLFLGMPVAFAIAISGFAFFLMRPEIPWTILVQKSLSTTQSFTMLAIPLFIFAGNLMNHTGITSRLVRLSNVLTGHMWGSIGQVSVVLSTLMGGVSGSAVADAAMECRILGPEMTKRGYAPGWAAAVNCLTGLIVATIPPSMGLILYGTVGEVSIGRLFCAGFVPGFIMCATMMVATSWSAHHYGYKPDHDKPSPPKVILAECGRSIWALMFPILLIIFIRFGVMTPSESGAFACFYALFVGVIIYKELDWHEFKQCVTDSVKDLSVITMILAFSGIFSYGVVYDQLPLTLTEMLVSLTSNKYLLLLLIIIMLTVFGMFMETTVITLIVTPILVPIIQRYGIDPVHFGIIMMTIVTMGCSTPPVGVALYTCSDIMHCKVEETSRYAVPYFIAIGITVAITVFFPQLILAIPNLVYGSAGV